MSRHSVLLCIPLQTRARFPRVSPDLNSCADKRRVPALLCPGCPPSSSAMIKLPEGKWEGEGRFLHALCVAYILFILYFAGIKSVSVFVAANLNYLKRGLNQGVGKCPAPCLLEY